MLAHPMRFAALFSGLLLMLALGPSSDQALANVRAATYKLDNGMQVVVIPDHRAPVVTHMVWYRIGAADEAPGVSGVAHFLEHLMFKSTEKIASGDFSKIVARLGGQDNAFTSQDATAYFQRIAKEHLPTVMRMEADRMVNLRLTDKEVATERDVIMEERRSRTENKPSAILDEQMSAALYQNHPYGIPVIGWMHEIAKLSRENALDFYKRFYAPNNAILVVSGDVEPAEVLKLAKEHYGPLPASTAIKPRVRPVEPPHHAARRLELNDPRAGKPSWHRYYLLPSYGNAKPGEAEALDLLAKVLLQGTTSRLYKRLVVEEKISSSAGGWYSGSGIDDAKLAIYAIAADGVSFDRIEASIDALLAEVFEKGITQAELDRAKKTFIAEYVYGSDNQAQLARRYGWALTTGQTVKDVEDWPDRIRKVTLEDIANAAKAHIDIRRSVTGYLKPAKPSAQATPVSKRS